MKKKSNSIKQTTSGKSSVVHTPTSSTSSHRKDSTASASSKHIEEEFDQETVTTTTFNTVSDNSMGGEDNNQQTSDENGTIVHQMQVEQEKQIKKTRTTGRMAHGLTDKQKEELQAILDESNIDIETNNVHIRGLLQEQLNICKANISKYVKDNILSKYIIELEETRAELEKTRSDYAEAMKRVRLLQEDLLIATKRIDRLKKLDQTATREAEKLKVKVKEIYEEQFDIRAENKRLKQERNTLYLENKKLRREKEALARELDISLLRMTKMITMNDKSLTPKQREERMQQEHQKYVKKLTSGVGELPPNPNPPSPSTKQIKNRTEREKELALELEIFVSRVEQLKPVVNVLRDGSLEFKKYLFEFLEHVVELLLREKRNPFFNASGKREDLQTSSTTTTTITTTTDVVTSISNKYMTQDELELSIREIMWALLDDPQFDELDDDLDVAKLSSKDKKTTSTKKKKKKVLKKQLLERKKVLIEKLRELERYKCSVDEMRKYIGRRVSKNDEWWAMLEKDLKDLLTQPSIGKYSGESPMKSPTPNRSITGNSFASPNASAPLEVHYNDLFAEDTNNSSYVQDEELEGLEFQNNHQSHVHDEYCHTDMRDNLDLQHQKLHMLATYAHEIPSILEQQNKKSRYSSRLNVTNNTNFFYDMNVSPPGSAKRTPGGSQSAAISIFQRDKRQEIFKKQNSSKVSGSSSPSSPRTVRSPLQDYTRHNLPLRGAFSESSPHRRVDLDEQ